jgi:DNA-binding LacI/PurR family transcriptional regulator
MLDVAKKANVALSTVSYAINGTRPISEETRQRIFAAMEELNFRPNVLARGLASRRSRIIALLFPGSERGLGMTELEFVTSAADAAREKGYNLVLWPSEIHDPAELRQFTQQGLIDGVVVMEIHQNDERINLLRETGFPFTMIGRCADTTGIGFVDIDFEKTIQEVIAYLSSLGHTQIGFLNQSHTLFDTGYGPVFRTQASFEETIRASGLVGISRFCRANPQCGYDTFRDMLAERPGLSAIISMNERATPGVMRVLADKKWSMPQDFSLVVAVSSARLAEMMTPPLTTSDAPTAELARLSVEHLIQQLETGESNQQQVLVPCHLVVRGSTGPNLRLI